MTAQPSRSRSPVIEPARSRRAVSISVTQIVLAPLLIILLASGPLPGGASAALAATTAPQTPSLALLPAPGPASPAAVNNPIVTENQQPGTNAWLLGSPRADDTANQMKGYWSAVSAKAGDTITLYATTNPAQSFTLDIYRMGWYQGWGGRLRLTTSLTGISQTPCTPDATTGMIACNWTGSYSLTIPNDWLSGVYLGLLTNAAGFRNNTIFVVRDDRPAPFLYQQSINTDQAYNNYPSDGTTGKSLYTFNSFGANTISSQTRAVKVSFDRPYSQGGFDQVDEIEFLRWIERMGYDVTYQTDVDTHANPGGLRNHKAVLSVGHDEYWSKEMRDGFEGARDGGVNLAFFAADTSEVQVRYEASAAGVANRVIVCYKDASIDPVQGPTTTVQWRMPPVNRPEQLMTGVTITGLSYSGNYPLVVMNTSPHWIYANTNFKDGDSVAGLVGYEMDKVDSAYALPAWQSHTILSQSPFTDANGSSGISNSHIYLAPSGAWVWASGTIAWSRGLDGYWYQRADARIQQMTANLFNAFLNGAPLDTLFMTVPTTAIAGQPFTIDVTAADSLGNPIAQYGGTAHFSSSDTASGTQLPPDSKLTKGQGSFSVTLTTAGPQTITVSDAAASKTTTVPITVSAAPASRFALATSGNPTVGTSFTFTVAAQDQYGNTDTGYAGTVHFTSSDTSAVLPANATLTNGQGSFSATLTKAGAQTIVATDTATAAITGTLALNVHGTAGSLDVAVPATARAGQAFSVAVTARNSDGTIATGYTGTVHFTSSDTATGVVLPPDSTLTSGQGTFSATLVKAGTQTITAADSANALSTTVSVAISAASATKLVLASSASPVAGTSFGFTIKAQDQFGNTDLAYAGTVHFTSTDTATGVALPADTMLSNGQATLAATLVRAGAQTITGRDTVSATITGTLSVNVRAAAATKLVLSSGATPTAGATFSFSVTAQDQFGNTDTGYAGTVHFTSSDTSAGVVLPADSTLTNGQRTLSATLIKAGAQTITGRDTVTATITGTLSVTVRAGAAASLTLDAPGSAKAGQAFTVSVTLKDQYGNVATGYRGTVHFATSDPLPTVVLPADYTFTAADAGTHTFTQGVTLWTIPSQTVSATDTVNASLTQFKWVNVNLL